MNDVHPTRNLVKTISRTAFAVIAVATLCVGCSATPPQKEAENDYKAPVYRTGSRIPVGRETPGQTTSASDVGPNDWQNIMPPRVVLPGAP
jgi:hypothetical protein